MSGTQKKIGEKSELFFWIKGMTHNFNFQRPSINDKEAILLSVHCDAHLAIIHLPLLTTRTIRTIFAMVFARIET
jgi:hypothetical protein